MSSYRKLSLLLLVGLILLVACMACGPENPTMDVKQREIDTTEAYIEMVPLQDAPYTYVPVIVVDEK